MSLDELKSAMRARALDIAMHLFPHGRREGRSWRIGDVTGAEGRKLDIVVTGIKSGIWKDWSNAEEKNSLLDLWAMNRGYHGEEGWLMKAAEEAASFLGHRFEREQRDHRDAPQKPRQKGGSKLSGNFVPPPQQPRYTAPKPAPPSFEEEWKAAVIAFSDGAAAALAAKRGYSVESVEWLRSQGLLGVIETRHGPALALPVHDEHGRVIAAHVRNRQADRQGNAIQPPPPPWQYIYHGAGDPEKPGPGTRPLIIGDLANATRLWVFESQWDAFAVLDRLELWRGESEWPPLAFFITRGAGNGGLVAPYVREGRSLILWVQRDEPDAKGNIPAEKWVQTIVEHAGSSPVRRIDTPAPHKDPCDWLKASPPPDADTPPDEHHDGRLSMRELLEYAAQARPARVSKLPAVRDMAFALRPENRRPEPPVIVHGILHRGSKLIVGGTSKGRKSWALLDLSLAVATGGEWWGFKCVQGRVLYVNFEIQEPFFEGRAAILVESRRAHLPPGVFQAITLRGNLESVEDVAAELIALLRDLEPFALIVIDPVYKLMAGKDENKAGDVGLVMAHLERIAVDTGAAVAFGAHYSKGNQAAKESIDRIGGSGVFARDPDAILTMTAHQEEDAFTVDATLRNFPPQPPFAVRWSFPRFERDDSLDPAALKVPMTARERAAASQAATAPAGKHIRKNSALVPALEMLRAVWSDLPRSHRYGDALRKATDRLRDEYGNPIKETTAKKYFGVLLREEYITGQKGEPWRTTEKGDAFLDAETTPPATAPEPEPAPESES